MKIVYHVDDQYFTDPYRAVDYIFDNLPENAFDETLDENYDALEIMGLRFEPSYILKELNFAAYRELEFSWKDGEYGDALYTIRYMIDGDEENIWGFTVRAEDIEADGMSASA